MRIKNKTLYLILNSVKNLLALIIIIAVFCLISPGKAEAAGWLSGWEQRRIKLTIDCSKVDSDLSDFPILVYLSTSSGIGNTDVSAVFDELDAGGGQGSYPNRKKIAVTKDDGETQLYVEIENWDDGATGNEEAWLWVKVSGTNSISSSTDTELYLYYDNDHADNDTYVGDVGSATAQIVWDDNYRAVWHLSETSGGIGVGDVSSGTLPSGGAWTLTIEHTVSGTDKLLVVGISIDNDWQEMVTGVTWNGTALAHVVSISMSDDARAEIWYLKAPEDGTYNVVVTLTGDRDGPSQYTHAGVITFTGVDQTTSFGATSTYQGDPALPGPSLDVASSIGDVIFGVAAVENQTFTGVGTGQTAHWLLQGGICGGGGTTKPGEDTSTNISFTYDVLDHVAMVGVAIKPAIPDPIKDATQYGNHGTDGGSPGIGVDGKIGKAVEFYKVDEYIDCGTGDLGLTGKDEMTIEVWFVRHTAGDWHDRLFLKGMYHRPFCVRSAGSSTMRISIEMTDGSADWDVTGFAEHDTDWYHFALRVKADAGGDDQEVYENGIKVGGAELPGIETFYLHSTDNTNMIGARPGSPPTYPWDGIIDEVRISNIDRGAAWLKASYNSGNDSLVTYGSVESPPIEQWYTSRKTTNETNTSATVWDTYHTMDVTPTGSNEDWIVIWSFDVGTAEDYGTNVRVTVNDITKHEGTLCAWTTDFQIKNYRGFVVLENISSTQTIDLDYKMSNSGATATAYFASIVAFRLDINDSDVDWDWDETDAGQSIGSNPSSPTTIAQVSVNPSTTGDYLVIGTFQGSGITNPDNILFRIEQDAVNFDPDVGYYSLEESYPSDGVYDYDMHMLFRVVNLTTGSKTFALKATADALNACRDAKYSRLAVVRLEDVYTYEYEEILGDLTKSDNVLADLESITFTADAEEYAFFGQTRVEMADKDNEVRIRMPDSDEANEHEWRGATDEDDLYVLGFSDYKTLTSGSQTIELQGAVPVYAGGTIVLDNRKVLILKKVSDITPQFPPTTPTLIRIFDNAIFNAWPSYKCTLSVVSTDPGEDDIEYEIQWDTEPDFGSAASNTIGPYASGVTVTTTISLGSTPAEAETLFYWKARARDPLGSNTWSSWSDSLSFTMDMDLENEYPYWYQVAGPQFEQGTKNGVTVQGDSVVFSSTCAEIEFQRASGSQGLSHSINIGSAGNDRLVVVIAGDESSGTSLTNVTVDGKNCTKAGEADNLDGAGNHQELWYILEATLGASNGTVTVTCTGGDAGWATHVHVYYGVKQSTPYDFEVEDLIVGGATISVEDVSSLNGSVVIFGAGQGDGGLTPSWTSPLTVRTDGPDPSSADLATASDLESTGQTNKTYVCTWSETFNRGTGIVAVWEPSESNEGILTSPAVVFADLFNESSNNRDDWDGVKWTKSSAADSIGLQIEYKDGGTWSLVPEDTIPGNLNGFFFPTASCYIDLASINTSIYDTLRMKATFKSYTAKSASDPALLMWALGNQSSIVTGISTIDKPMVFALYRNRPNPFTNRTEIRYQIPKRVKVELQVFDVIGRSVVTLVNKEQKPGYYFIQWKGMNKNKKLLPFGVYFLRMEAGDFKATQKMVRLR